VLIELLRSPEIGFSFCYVLARCQKDKFRYVCRRSTQTNAFRSPSDEDGNSFQLCDKNCTSVLAAPLPSVGVDNTHHLVSRMENFSDSNLLLFLRKIVFNLVRFVQILMGFILLLNLEYFDGILNLRMLK